MVGEYTPRGTREHRTVSVGRGPLRTDGGDRPASDESIEGFEGAPPELQADFEDLTPKQQAVVSELVHDAIEEQEHQDSDIATTADVDGSYPQKVRDRYGGIVTDFAAVGIVPEPTKEREDEDKTERELVLGGLTEDCLPDDLDPETERVIEALAQFNPMPPETLSGRLDVPAHRIREVKTLMTDCIEVRRRRLLLDVVESDLDPESRDLWDDLTYKQQSTVLELSKEPDPLNPARDKQTIARYADIHPTYITLVIDRVGELATEIRARWIDLVPRTAVDDVRVEAARIEQVAEAEVEKGGEGECVGRLVVATRLRDMLDGVLGEDETEKG